MANVIAGVRSYLLTKTVITDFVGLTRIHLHQLKQSATLPAIVMTRLFTTHEHDLSDLSGLAHARLQFECYASTQLVADSLARAIKGCGIVTQKGLTNGLDIRGVRVEEGLSDKDEAPTDGGNEYRYFTVIDLVIDYTET